MAKLTTDDVRNILTTMLRLKDAEFQLEKAGPRLIGNVISSTFKGKPDHQRQEMIWTALESELGDNASRQVGLLLAYTPDEWNLGKDLAPTSRRTKKAG